MYMSRRVLEIALSSLIVGTRTAPTSGTPSSTPASTPEYVGFVGDPNGRGTASLVISCLLTLLLCVWSALHLNIPRREESLLSHYWVNVRWIVTGVYAPELVVFVAWRQWSSAKILGGLVSQLDENDITTQAQRLASKWTLTHGFFASTGGFAFEIPYEADDKQGYCPFLPKYISSPTRVTITARGMALLVRCGHLPEVSEADIADKSKANDIAKALVIIQASWMLVQVIARLIVRLPVTLLEVNTIAHVMCAFLMYAMWWNKPLSPKEPFIMRGDWVAPLCAYMYMSSEMSGEVSQNSIKSQTKVKTLFASLHLFSRVPEMESMAYCIPQHIDDHSETEDSSNDLPVKPLSSNLSGKSDSEGAKLPARSPTPPLTHAFVPASKDCLTESQVSKLEKTAGTAFFERRPRVKAATFKLNDSSLECRERWRLAASAIQTYPAIKKHYLAKSHQLDRCLHFKSEELLVPRVQNWPWDDLLRNVGGLIVGMILWLACFAYGSIHAAAWNDHFPSPVEKWIWRSSSLYIAFCGGLWIVLNYIVLSNKTLNTFWERWMDGGGKWWQNVIISIPVVICGGSLILARAFIVIEAFVSIRELPAGAYDTPTWSQVFPHF